jgi:hypothetical protein
MKIIQVASGVALLAIGALGAETSQVAVRYRYVQYRMPRHHPPPAAVQTNQANRAKPAEPQDKPVKFRELPLNAEFYFVVDKDRKLFPRIKISETSARTVPTPGSPNVTTSPVPGETLVIAKKAAANDKDDKKDQGGKRK